MYGKINVYIYFERGIMKLPDVSKNRKIFFAVFYVIAFVSEIIGILSIITVGRIGGLNILPFYDGLIEINLILAYVVVIVFMSIGILLFSNLSARLTDIKWRKKLTIGITIYAFILTLPLVYVFLACFADPTGACLVPIPMVNEAPANVPLAFYTMVKGNLSGCYAIYFFGTVMSLIFLAVPLHDGIKVVKACNKVLNEKN